VADRDAGEVPLRSLGEHRRPADQVGARREVRQLLAVAPTALVAGAHAHHGAVVDQQLGGGGLRQDVDAGLLGAAAEPPAELRDRGDVVAVIAKRRRHPRQPDRAAPGHQVDVILRDGAVGRPLPFVEAGKQAPHRRRLHHRPRQQMGPGRLALLDERDGHLAQCAGEPRLRLEELHQPDGAGKARRTAADDHDPHLDALPIRVGRAGHELPDLDRGRMVRRPDRVVAPHRGHPRCRPSIPAATSPKTCAAFSSRSSAARYAAKARLRPGRSDRLHRA
jgi:hypothetical protein